MGGLTKGVVGCCNNCGIDGIIRHCKITNKRRIGCVGSDDFIGIFRVGRCRLQLMMSLLRYR